MATTPEHLGSNSANHRNRERGAVTVEFGLVLLPLMGLLLIILDVAWIFFGWACIQEGTREGVRYAVTCPAQTHLDSAISSVVQQYSFGFAQASNISIKYCSPTDTSNPCNGLSKSVPLTGGDVIQVTVSAVPVGSFGPIYRTATPVSLSASSADMLEPSCSSTPN